MRTLEGIRCTWVSGGVCENDLCYLCVSCMRSASLSLSSPSPSLPSLVLLLLCSSFLFPSLSPSGPSPSVPLSLSRLLPQVCGLLGDPTRLLMHRALSLRPPGLVPLGKGLLGDSPTGKLGQRPINPDASMKQIRWRWHLVCWCLSNSHSPCLDSSRPICACSALCSVNKGAD